MSSPTIGVQSIRRAFAVLRALADGPLGVTEVAGAVPHPEIDGRPPPGRARRRGRRRAGARASAATGSGRDLLALASGLGETWDIVAIARARRSSTSPRELGEAAGLSIRDGWTVHYVDQVEPPNPNPVQVRDWTGTRIPLHAVSSGQVFLAQLPAPMLARYLAEPLEAFTPRTLTDAPAAARAAARGAARRPRLGSRRVRDRASAPWPRRSPTRAARSSPRSTSTGRRTGSRPRATRIGSRRRCAPRRRGSALASAPAA